MSCTLDIAHGFSFFWYKSPKLNGLLRTATVYSSRSNIWLSCYVACILVSPSGSQGKLVKVMALVHSWVMQASGGWTAARAQMSVIYDDDSSCLKPDLGWDVQLAAETRFLGSDSCSRKVIASSSAQTARKALSLSSRANCVLWFTTCWSFSLQPDSLQVLWWENVTLHLSYTLLPCTVISLSQPKRLRVHRMSIFSRGRIKSSLDV